MPSGTKLCKDKGKVMFRLFSLFFKLGPSAASTPVLLYPRVVLPTSHLMNVPLYVGQ